MADNFAQTVTTNGVVDEDDSLARLYLTFHLAGEDYGLPIRYVIEIIGIQRITDVPDMPPYIKGVINLRGKVVPVMDVRTRFLLPDRDYTERTCIIVVEVGGISVGLVVDEVREVADIPSGQIEPPPRNMEAGGNYIAGIGKVGDEVKILLDIHRLLYHGKMGPEETGQEGG